MTFKYQIAVLGQSKDRLPVFRDALLRQTDALGLDRAHIQIVEESKLGTIDEKSPLVVVFFGYVDADDSSHTKLRDLLAKSVTVIPCVDRAGEVSRQLPESIRHINAYQSGYQDADWARLITLVLENLRLLRAERRLFISYKRSESQSIAVQLYEAFDKAGFDVFLDTRSVPCGEDFQSILWHRMADSDVVVLLDTPNFRVSYWTTQEQARANATNIQILHLLWPRVRADKSSAFSEFHQLHPTDFRGRKRTGAGCQLIDKAADDIVAGAESLRARALAARHRSLVDNFCDQAKHQPVKYLAVQPERYISVELNSGTKVAVVPTIGVPRADRYHEIEDAIRKSGSKPEQVWLLYDERGILESWLNHLDWLDSHLPVSSVRVSRCAGRLGGGAK
ncbi:toll/interleukin-1 receptor domain-containing protein [Bradyrhizobium sp. CW4]|uniref:toll/interleukin-1 receptor domain-containing protein n=1 Tax=Bradyrhizobium sp. CW4 TaxID=2782687 RepID=UPI001FF70343|nr:toll/interleukin-1 receptor domain-containing protein [Bradyrhizobium sp. CW4]MCK1417667.1 toll/interleukin-1 receptor domain-containing protein [Bradyrhizobium sp. CW4]